MRPPTNSGQWKLNCPAASLTARTFIVDSVIQGLTAGQARPEADEKIEMERFSLRRLEGMMKSGALRDAKSIAGILYYARFVKRRR